MFQTFVTHNQTVYDPKCFPMNFILFVIIWFYVALAAHAGSFCKVCLTKVHDVIPVPVILEHIQSKNELEKLNCSEFNRNIKVCRTKANCPIFNILLNQIVNWNVMVNDKTGAWTIELLTRMPHATILWLADRTTHTTGTSREWQTGERLPGYPGKRPPVHQSLLWNITVMTGGQLY